ncbi:MAG TPA: outer membrane protein assembly factor BamE [Candidatus Methylacidiphilales bacterium]
MKRILLALLAPVLLLSACASKLTDENLRKVRTGMSVAEVKAILGSPDKSETSETLGIRATTYYYKTSHGEVKISFLNDNVMVKEGAFSK